MCKNSTDNFDQSVAGICRMFFFFKFFKFTIRSFFMRITGVYHKTLFLEILKIPLDLKPINTLHPEDEYLLGIYWVSPQLQSYLIVRVSHYINGFHQRVFTSTRASHSSSWRGTGVFSRDPTSQQQRVSLNPADKGTKARSCEDTLVSVY